MRILLAAALVAATLPMAAQVSATGTAKVVILPAAATLVHGDYALDFGTIVASGAVQTKTVAFDQRAGVDRFSFTKDRNEILSVTVDPTCQLTNPDKKVGLTAALTAMATGNDNTATDGTIFVGGTLTVPAWTLKASYAGTYTVTIAYM